MFTCEGKNTNNFYLWREEHKQWLLSVKGRTQTMTFTCEGKNTNNDFYLWREEHKQWLLPVKGRTQTNYFYLWREEPEEHITIICFIDCNKSSIAFQICSI
jgi:hypothetical protein